MNSLSPFSNSGDVSSRGWAISFGDLLTLLLCFFVLFISTESSQNADNLHLKNVSDEFYPQNRIVMNPTGNGIPFATASLADASFGGVSFLIADSMQVVETRLQEMFITESGALSPEAVAGLTARVTTCARGSTEEAASESTLISSLLIGEELIKKGFRPENIRYQPLGDDCGKLPVKSWKATEASQAVAVIRFS